MSLYAEYVKERLGDNILEDENGFATYRYINDGKTVYIVDIYVKPELRKHKLGSTLADKICEEAKREGAVELLGTVSPMANTATESLGALLSYGMKLVSSNEQMIVFRKDL